ncbi:molybdate ABC transporter substrate-binding protein [Paenibacillus sp. SAFN-054]|uniref:molybdate ABC transporter substrate-binding protein n=2 Tax=unclassified Paenibacillus TaxID=185978 RepID=UPI003F8004B0
MISKSKSNVIMYVLVAMMLVFAAGCGNSSDSKSDSQPSGAASGSSDTNVSNTTPAKRVDLTISAAASMTDALGEIEKSYEAAHPNIELRFNFGGSGALQKQIEQGAPADLFLSAATKNMTPLIEQNLIEEGKELTLLTNELVAVVPADGKAAVAALEDLDKAEVKKVAVGIPESVPAGNYAKEALTNAKQWDALQPKMVQAKDVRQVLQYVETGNADVGFVYKTDALTSQKVKIAFVVDPASYSVIEYPIGVVQATKHPKEAEDFYDYLQSQASLDVFIKYGFTVPK